MDLSQITCIAVEQIIQDKLDDSDKLANKFLSQMEDKDRFACIVALAKASATIIVIDGSVELTNMNLESFFKALEKSIKIVMESYMDEEDKK